MKDRLSFNDPESAQEFNDEQPKYFKPAEQGQTGTMRVAFLTDDVKYKLVYSLKDWNEKVKNNFRGTFVSLTYQSGLGLKEITKLIRGGDPEGKLKVDVKMQGKAPDIATILPALKYMTNANGQPDIELFKSGAFEVGFVWISGARYRSIQQELSRFREEGKSIQDLDFVMSIQKGVKAWDIRAEEKSLYGKNRSNPALKKKIDERLNAEFKRLGVKNMDELIDTYLGQSLTEDQWVQKLNQFGYFDRSKGQAGSVSATPESSSPLILDDSSPASEFDGELDFSDVE